MINQEVIPLTLAELNELILLVSRQVPIDTPIQIVANQDRVCIKEIATNKILSWVRRTYPTVIHRPS